METSIKTNLCKGLRACGISKETTHEIMNTFETWYDNNGAEWTLKRIKDLRQWYETSLTGKPVPPEWFRHDKEGLPTGVWKVVFNLPTAKALGVLSIGTVLYEKSFSETQQKKFLHGLRGSGTQDLDTLRNFLDFFEPRVHWKRKPSKMPDITFPTIFDMNGSVPVHDGHETIRPNGDIGIGLKALEESWDSLPQVTFDFLDRMDLLGFMPMDVLGNQYTLELNKPRSPIVGRVSVIQEPELKARVVANPNRVTQVTLEPLKRVLMDLVRSNPCDCIFNQQEGMEWVQEQLRQGIELAGSDLTSASDLLSLDGCLMLLDRTYGLKSIDGYQDFIDYFKEVSRADWYCPSLDKAVRWEVGDPLGTGPSIGLLSTSNSAACNLAVEMAKADGLLDQSLRPEDCFRVLGDDIIMRAPIAPYYNRIIECLGGEINHSKTLTSNKVAEFAGRIITPERIFLKKIKFSEPSDTSFMDYMRQLGDQAKYFLKPKQRRVYDFYKFVPGFLHDLIPAKGWEGLEISGATWMEDSFGIPLGQRYSWYLTEVKPVLDKERPDQETVDYDSVLLKAELSNAQAGIATSKRELSLPLVDEGYLPSQVTPSFKTGGDPRLVNNESTLERLSRGMRHISPFTRDTDTNPSANPEKEVEGVDDILAEFDRESSPVTPERFNEDFPIDQVSQEWDDFDLE